MDKTVELLDGTVEHCDFVSTCHYIQAEGNKHRRIQVGLPALLLNVAIGSVLVADLGKVIPDPVKWITAIVALSVSLLVAIQTFFHFDEDEKAHRMLGNDFNRISRRLARLKAAWLDKTVADTEFARDFGATMDEYEKVCAENEKCPPSRAIGQKVKKSWKGRIAIEGS